jgi:L-ascorbate 6-phosphate lactonase
MEEIHSTWGDWLPREIEEAHPESVRLWYLGCNGFVLKSSGGTTLFIDPYLGTGDPPRTIRMIPVPFDPTDIDDADGMLVTHEHTDHVHGPSQAPILAGTGASLYAPPASLDVTAEEGWTEHWDVTSDQLHDVTVGDTFDVGDLTVHVEAANDPDAEQPVAYVIEHESGTFVHGGDARPGDFDVIGETYDVDLGALAFGSVGMILDKETHEPSLTKWYSDENMLIESANELQVDRLVPTHWDMWKGLTADPGSLVSHARSFEYPRDVDVVEIGDTIDL